MWRGSSVWRGCRVWWGKTCWIRRAGWSPSLSTSLRTTSWRKPSLTGWCVSVSISSRNSPSWCCSITKKWDFLSHSGDGNSPWQHRLPCRTPDLTPSLSSSPAWSGDFWVVAKVVINLNLNPEVWLGILSLNPFRWTKLRINMVPATVLEPVSECFLASLIIGWAAHYVFRYSANHRAESRHPPVSGFSLLGGQILVLNCGLCLSQVGHDGLLHVSLSSLVYIRLHPTHWSSGSTIHMLLFWNSSFFFFSVSSWNPDVMFAAHNYLSLNCILFFRKSLILGYWWILWLCRADRCASPSWTSLWPGSSESPWPCRFSSRLCGTRRSAGEPGGTGCAAVAPLRRSSMSSNYGNHLLMNRKRAGDQRKRLMFICFFFYGKNWRGCVCVCVWMCVCVCVCVYVRFNYLCSFRRLKKMTSEQVNDSSTNKVWSDKSRKSEANYWAEFLNYFLFTRLACSKPHKMLLL